MSNAMRYGSYSIESLNEDADRAAGIAGGTFMELEVGENVVRFLPPRAGEKSPFRITAMHYIDAVPGLDKLVVFACPRHEVRRECPACVEAERLNKTGNPLDRDRAFRISAGLRIYANVLDRKHPESGIKVLAFGKQIQQQLKVIRANSRFGGDFTAPGPTGFDVVIMREGTGRNDTKYTVSADRNNSSLAATEEEAQALIDAQHDLEQFVNVTPPEELLSYFNAQRMMGAPSRSRALPPERPTMPEVPRVGASLMERRAAAKAAVVVDAPKSEDEFGPSYGGKG